MILLYLSIPFMLIGAAIALIPLVWGMKHQRSWEDGARAIEEEVVGGLKHSEEALASVLLGKSAELWSLEDERLRSARAAHRARARVEELAAAS